MEEHGGPTRVTAERSGQSRMGIASFVIAILTTVLLVVLLVVVFNAAGRLLEGADPQSVTPQDLQRNLEQNPGSTGVLGVAGFGLAATPLLYILGAALGIAGLVQKRRGRLFAVLGTVSNALILFGLLILILFGALVGTAV
jgi:Co/Zn/Cd efflux system component